MTNDYIDFNNIDMMLVMGGNPAENHPCGLQAGHRSKAQAKIIVVNPRLTRTAATADQKSLVS